MAVPFACGSSGGGQSAISVGGGPSSYPDVIFYHNCDALGNAQKAGGSATITYTAGWSLATLNGETPILGPDSWDQNDDGYDRAYIETAGNIPFSGGRIGFYIQPRELATGRAVATHSGIGTATTSFVLYNAGDSRLYFLFMGQTDNPDVGLSVGVTAFVEVKFVGNDATLYVDGEEVVTLNGSGTPSEGYLAFGAVDGNAWDALYDQVICTNDPDRSLYAIRNVTSFG